MLNKDQAQNVSDGSTAIQAGGNVTIVKAGVSYSEAREIALEIFETNFYKLAGVAKETADKRAKEITDQFLSNLQKENPSGIGKSSDPDFQYALFTTQKEYARSGDKDLGDLLVDLLVDRSKQGQRDILQIVLNESLSTAPKLTQSQIAALSLRFLFAYTQNFGVGNHQMLGEYLDKFAAAFIPQVVKNMACYQHLEFCGCGNIGISGRSLEWCLGTTYQGQFVRGFDNDEVTNRGVSLGFDPRFFIPCLNDPTKLQVNANSKDSLEKALEANGVSTDDRGKVLALFEVGKMSEVEIRDKCVELRPYMSGLFDVWTQSALKQFSLTSVGIAIGHANIKRLAGPFADLSIWIN